MPYAHIYKPNEADLFFFFILIFSFTQIPDMFVNHLKLMAPQLRMSVPDLRQLLKSLCEAVSDQSFIKQILVINDHVTAMSADN